MGANASLIREVDWDGNVIWEYKNKRIHHDFVKRLLDSYLDLPNCQSLFDFL